MKYTKEILKNKKVRFEVEVSKEEWTHQVQHAYEHEKHKYTIQGFRKGAAPKQLIEKMYGEGVFYDHALEHCFYDYYNEILDKEKDLEPIANPHLDVKGMDKDGATLIIEVEVKPEVSLGEYKGLTIQKMDTLIAEQEVEAELLLAQDKASRFVEVDTPIKQGDSVTFDFTGSVEGVPFEGGSAKGYELEIGSGQFIPGFEEQMIGLEKGQTKNLDVTFPENYHAENLKGKASVFEVTIHNIKQKELPEINDELAKNMSEFDSLKEWKEDIKSALKTKKQEEAKLEAENSLINQITENATVEAPEVMVKEQIDAFIKEFEFRLMYQGLKLEDYLNMIGTTLEELRADRREDAIKTVKTKLVLEKIIKQEKLDITEEEFSAKLDELSAKEKKSKKEFEKSLNQQRADSIVNGLMVEKLLNFLRDNNNL